MSAELLAHIVAEPDDRAARLVYADAIGGARGEAIVLGETLAAVGIATVDDLIFDRATDDLALRANQLRRMIWLHREHAAAWQRDLGLADTEAQLAFRGGWPSHIHLFDRGAIMAFAELARVAPVTSLDVHPRDQAMLDELALHRRALAHVREVDVYGPPRALEWTAVFAALPELRAVRWHTRAEPSELAAIADLSALRELAITNPTEEVLARLAAQPIAQRLERVRIRYAWVLDDTRPYPQPPCDRPVFAAFPRARVRELDVSAEVGRDLVALVAGVPAVERLAFRASTATGVDVAALAGIRGLRRLAIGGLRAGPDAIASVLAMHALEALHLGSYGPEHARAIVVAPGATGLRSLALPWRAPAAADAEAIAGSPRLAGLRDLTLSGAGLGNATEMFAALPSLVRLELDRCEARPSMAYARHATLVEVAGCEPLAGPPLRAAWRARFGGEIEVVSELHLFAGAMDPWVGKTVEMGSICDRWLERFLADAGISAQGHHFLHVAGTDDVKVRLNAENTDHDLARGAATVDASMARVIGDTDPILECHFPPAELAAAQRVIRRIAHALGRPCVLWNRIDDTVEMIGRRA